MNAAAHYREAERLSGWDDPASLAMAQIHATLAVAAALGAARCPRRDRYGQPCNLDAVHGDQPCTYEPVEVPR